jgi:predicted nucleotidyltransferase
MVTLIQNKRDAIVELCEKYGVVRLDVFGSVLRDDFCTARSDIDLLVDFSGREPYACWRKSTSICSTAWRGCSAKVDLVMAGAVKNPYIAADIEETKQLLYAA